jgi:uncharacterized membrane protein
LSNDRLLIPVDADYLHAIGMAVYTFATLEWDAVWCCLRLDPASLPNLAKMTAGQITSDLVRLAATRPTSAEADELRAAAAECKRLVDVRNAIIHANPGTAPDGAQRLFRQGTNWSIAALNDASDEFTRCASRLNAILYGYLKDPSDEGTL